jgi:hypothetical protein
VALGLGKPIFSAMAGHVHSQFQPTPDSKFVKCPADDLANFAIALKPSQTRVEI